MARLRTSTGAAPGGGLHEPLRLVLGEDGARQGLRHPGQIDPGPGVEGNELLARQEAGEDLDGAEAVRLGRRREAPAPVRVLEEEGAILLEDVAGDGGQALHALGIQKAEEGGELGGVSVDAARRVVA